QPPVKALSPAQSTLPALSLETTPTARAPTTVSSEPPPAPSPPSPFPTRARLPARELRAATSIPPVRYQGFTSTKTTSVTASYALRRGPLPRITLRARARLRVREPEA